MATLPQQLTADTGTGVELNPVQQAQEIAAPQADKIYDYVTEPAPNMAQQVVDAAGNIMEPVNQAVSSSIDAAAPYAQTTPGTAAAEPAAIAPPEPVSTPTLTPQVQQAITPSPVEVQQKLDEKLAPVRKIVADTRAQKQANDELSKYMQEEEARREQVKREMLALEEQDNQAVRAQSFQEMMAGGIGQKITALLAVGLGAAAQGYNKLASNPVLDFIDRQVEQQAQKDRLSLDKKNALKKQMLEAGQNTIMASQKRFDNVSTQQNLQLQYDKLEQAKQSLIQKQLQSYESKAASSLLAQEQMQGTLPIQGSPAEVAAIKAHNELITQAIQTADPKRQEALIARKIVLPNGKITIASATEAQVGKFNEVRAENDSAQKLITDIKAYMKDANKLNPFDRAEIQTRMIALTGKLRPAFLGPGAMTEKEFQRLYDAVGDPTKLTSLTGIELKKLAAVEDVLAADTALKAQSMAGVAWPVTKRAQAIKKLVSAGKSMREAVNLVDRLISR